MKIVRNATIRNYALTLLGVLLSAAASANQWVTGNVSILDEYGSYANGNYQVLITLTNKSWGGGNTQDGEFNCTERLRLKIGEEGVDENIKDRIFTMMLTAITTKQRVGLYVNTGTGPYCTVQIGRIFGY